MKRTLHAVTLGFGIAMLCMAGVGCSLLSPPKIKVERALLNQLPLDVPRRESHSTTVLVLPPKSTAIYDTTQMAYQTQPYEIAYFSEREWGETPAQMLYPLLVKTLEKTRSFSAVLVPPYAGRYTYALRTEILELTQEFTRESPTLVLSLRFQLTDYEAREVSATREVSVREPMRQRSSYAGVVAANEATAKALQQMAVFVLEKTH